MPFHFNCFRDVRIINVEVLQYNILVVKLEYLPIQQYIASLHILYYDMLSVKIFSFFLNFNHRIN